MNANENSVRIILLMVCATMGAAERPKALVEIVDMAMAGPPELAADALIRVAQQAPESERAWRIELLERAVQLASSAKFPYLFTGAVGRARHTDSEPGVRWSALELGLDALTLQIRATTLMLSLDRARGRDLFERIPRLRLPALACRDALKPDVSVYYQAVKLVYEQGFTAQERQKGKHFEMLLGEVRALQSPLQLEPVTRMLLELKLNLSDFEAVVTAYASGLSQLNADDRSFTAGTHHGLTQAFFDLVKRCRTSEISILPLVDAERTYLTRHLQAARCGDSADFKGEGATIANVVKLFNTGLVGTTPEVAEVRPISDDEMKPLKAEGTAEVIDFWKSAKSQALLQTQKVLRFGPWEDQLAGRAKALTLEQRKSADWENQVRMFMEDLERWDKEHEESAAIHFHQTCFAYRSLVDLIPAGALRDTVLASVVRFLAMSDMQRGNPPEWLMEVRALRQAAGVEAEMARNGNASLALDLRLRVLTKGK